MEREVTDRLLTRRELLEGTAKWGVLLSALTISNHSALTALERTSREAALAGLPIHQNPTNILKGTHPDQNLFKYTQDWEASLGVFPDITGFFIKPSNYEMVSPEITKAISYGSLPMLSWGEASVIQNFEGSKSTLMNLCNFIKSFNSPVLFRPYYEINIPTVRSWYGKYSPSQFIDVWRGLYDFLDKQDVQAYFVYCPYSTARMFLAKPDPASKYFPGKDYVHAVGLDTYHKRSIYPLDLDYWGYPNFSPSQMLGPDIANLIALAPEVPRILCEVNESPYSHYPGEEGLWTQNCIDLAISYGFGAALTFDWNKKGHSPGEHDWAVHIYPKTTKRLGNYFSGSYFSNSRHKSPEEVVAILFGQKAGG